MYAWANMGHPSRTSGRGLGDGTSNDLVEVGLADDRLVVERGKLAVDCCVRGRGAPAKEGFAGQTGGVELTGPSGLNHSLSGNDGDRQRASCRPACGRPYRNSSDRRNPFPG